MSRPSVVPRHAVTVGSLQGGTVIGKTPEERGKLHLEFQTLTPCRAVNKTKLIGRNCLIFRYARSFDFAQDDRLGGAPTPDWKYRDINFPLLVSLDSKFLAYYNSNVANIYSLGGLSQPVVMPFSSGQVQQPQQPMR